jgi:hypothetical protein
VCGDVTMWARLLAWYTCAALAFASFLFHCCTVAPIDESALWILIVVLGVAAAVFAVVGIVLGLLPDEHWCNRSRMVRVVLSVTAVLATALLLG